MNRRWTALEAASAGFVAANILHTLDHLRQGVGGLTWEIVAGGSVLTVLAVAGLVLALRRDQRAPAFPPGGGLRGGGGLSSGSSAPPPGGPSASYPAHSTA